MKKSLALTLVILTCFFNLISSQQKCEEDSQCGQFYHCNPENQECTRNSLLPISNLSIQEIIGSIWILSVIGFAQAAGVGGGVIVVPVLIQLFLFTTKQAVSLVFIVIFCGSIGNLLVLVPQKMKNGAPLIDYDLTLISMPTASAGAVFGVILNRFSPDILVISVLIYLLVTNIFKAHKKVKELKQKEILQKLKQQEMSLIQTPQQQLLEVNESNNNQQIANKQYPFDIFFKMIIVLIVTLIISMCRGGNGLDSIIGIEKCGKLYWVFNGLIIASSFVLLQIFYTLMIQQEQNIIKQKLKYITNCSVKHTTEYAQVSFLAALVGSYVGIGGGMILIPKWIELGVRAQQASANTIILITYNSFIAFIQFVIAGVYSLDQILFLGFLSLTGSFILAMIIKKTISEDIKDRVLQQILLGVQILAFFLMSLSTLKTFYDKPDELFSFGSIC